MKRRFALILFLAACAVVIPGSTAQRADAQQTITLRIATLAPRGSSWMRVFNAWNASLRQETGNRLQLRFYDGGSQGDERDFVRKMGSGQLDGAAVTAVGLGQIVRSVLVLQAPGLFSDYAALDRVRNDLAADFATEFEGAGYKLLGWGDAGRARIFSNRAINRPSDFRSVRPWVWRDDPVFAAVLSAAGANNGVRLSLPEVYPSLQTNMIDTVPASALAAVALQWFTRVQYVTKQSDSVIIGATVLKKDKFDALPADLQAALMSTSERAHATLIRNIRRDDDRAYRTIIDRGLHEVDLTAHQAEWTTLAETVRTQLAGRLYPRDLLERVERAARGR